MKKTIATFMAVLGVATYGSPQAEASGFRLLEQSNRAGGAAHAVTASVDDASAVYYNPAAMVNVGEYAASFGVQGLDPEFSYSGQGVEDLKTSNITYPIPHVYAMKSFGEERDLAVGLGVFSDFGGGSSWPTSGPFARLATDTQLATMNANLNVAKRLGDDLSLAVGVSFISINANYENLYPFGAMLPGSRDGVQVYENADGTAISFNAAASFKATDAITIGVTYRHGYTAELSGDFRIEGFPGALSGLPGVSHGNFDTTADATFDFPAIAVLGIAFKATDNVTLELDVDWTGWSAYEEVKMTFGDSLSTSAGTLLPSEATNETKYEDTISFRLGAAFDLDDFWTLRAGFGFDPSPIPAETVDPRLPDRDRMMATGGFSWQASDNFNVDASVGYIWGDTLTIENEHGAPIASGNGDYDMTIIVYGVSFGYRF